MAQSLLFVESRPAAPELADEYHRWHDEVHLPEMLTIDGFVSARRWATDGDTFITLYEIDTDVETARANVRAAFGSGRMSPPDPVQTDPPATQRWLGLISEVGG